MTAPATPAETVQHQQEVALWSLVRLKAEGSDWRRDQGETIVEWAARSLFKSAPSERAQWKEPERVRYPADHEWHVAINRHCEGKHGEERPSFMYDAKEMADEVPRMAYILRQERNGKLPQQHQQCSHQPVEQIENELTCCLGVKCRECPHLLALEKAERMTPEQIDVAKAWTCAAHIMSKGGDTMREGYILSTSDRIYWDRVHESLSQGDQP